MSAVLDASNLGEELELDGDEAQLSLEIAATLGDQVDYREWELACSLRDVALEYEWVEALAARRLVEIRDSGWDFVDGELRKNLVEMARRDRRWEKHNAACAQALYELYAGRSVAVARRRVAHLHEANKRRELMGPLLEAAREAYDAGELSASLEYLERHWELLDEFDVGSDDKRRAENLWRRAHRLYEMGEGVSALQLVEQSREILDEEVDAAELGEATLLCGRIVRDSGELDRAAELFEETLGYFAAAADDRGLARARAALGLVEKYRGRLDQARSHLAEALETFEWIKDEFMAASLLINIGITWLQSGRPERARSYLQRGRRVAHDSGHLANEASAHAGLGHIAMEEEDWEEARRYLNEAFALYETEGDRRRYLMRLNLALNELYAGNEEAAAELLEELIEVLPAVGYESWLVVALVARMARAARCGDWKVYDATWEQVAERLTESVMVHKDLATIAEWGARATIERGETERAEHLRELACDQYEQLGLVDRAQELRRESES
ncbi:MAG: tetratricopeptide repeat protein [Persicimonas sp.]